MTGRDRAMDSSGVIPKCSFIMRISTKNRMKGSDDVNCYRTKLIDKRRESNQIALLTVVICGKICSLNRA